MRVRSHFSSSGESCLIVRVVVVGRYLVWRTIYVHQWEHCGSLVPCSRGEVVSAFVEIARGVVWMAGRSIAVVMAPEETLKHAMGGRSLAPSVRGGVVDLDCVWARHQRAGVDTGILRLFCGVLPVSHVCPPRPESKLCASWLGVVTPRHHHQRGG